MPFWKALLWRARSCSLSRQHNEVNRQNMEKRFVHLHAMQGPTSQFLRCPSFLQGRRQYRASALVVLLVWLKVAEKLINLVRGFFYDRPRSSMSVQCAYNLRTSERSSCDVQLDIKTIPCFLHLVSRFSHFA